MVRSGSSKWMKHIVTLVLFLGSGIPLSNARLIWVKQPQNTAVRLGDDLTVPCLATWGGDGAPTISYSWTQNNSPLAEKASRLPDYSLFVPAVSSLDLGNYTCTVEAHFQDSGSVGGHHVLKSSALVIAAYLEPFLIDPESEARSVGETAVLTCVTGVSSPLVEVSWLRDGVPFDGGTVQTSSFGDFDVTGLTHQLSVVLTVEVSTDVFGQFQCRAWNPVLQEFELSKHAEISNKVKPSSDLPVILWDQPPVLVVGEGHDLVLPCKSTESTEPTKVSWYLGRYRVDESKRVYALSDSDNNLGFFPIRPQDSGQYSCRAQNSKGTVESPALDLVVAYLNIEFAVQPSNTFSVYGASAVLHCEPPDSIPVAQVFWYKDYLPLNLQAEENKGRLMLVGKGDLYLTSVQKSDNGLYYCEAYNNFTTPTSRASRQARLTVEGPPMIKVPPIRTEILKGTLLQLKCLVDADPTPVVTWMFEGRLIKASSMVSFVNRSQALIISNVDKSWEGWFTCRALNSYGNISADAFVTVIVPPESLRAIGNLVVTAGLPIRIPCPVLSDPMPEILWFYNNVQVYPKDMGAPSTLRWRVDSPDLYLDEAVPENAGNFTCVGINKGGSASSSGSLVVHTPPAVKVSPLKSTAVIGQTVTLTCVADGLPTPTIVWKFNTSLDLPMEVELSEDKETLTLKSLSWKSVGIYTCEGENIVGQGQAQAEVKAMVAPKILVIEGPEDPVKINSRVSLKCEAEGLPQPSIQWTLMGQPVVPSLNGRVRLPGRGLLVLEVAIVEDSGSYTCVCTSRVGKAEASVTLQVYGPPPPPVLLSAVPLSSQSIYLLWKWSGLTPDPPRRIDSFRVWYKEKQSERALIYPTVLGSNMTRLEIEGLKPHAEYVFYITVQGDSGTSPPSNLLSAITLQAEPSPPQNLRTIKISRTSVTITWEVPATPNGIIKEYQLMYQRLGDIYDDYTILNISFPEFPTHETTLSDFRPYTKYTVKVKAANVESGVMLWGDFSPPLVFWTLMSVPALPPQFVEVTSDSPYSIQVSWQEIPNLAQNGPILFYHVTCIEAKSGKSETVRVDKSSKTTEIFGLFPWRNYTVTVRGENPKGLSPASDPFIGLTLPIAPVAPPSNLKVDSRSSSTLTLHWERLPDELVTCNITAYKIEYRQSGDPDWTSILAIPIILSSSLMQHTIDSLRSWTWYEARVAAFTASITPGLGPFTEPVMARTTQGESGPVTAVSFTSDENTIVLSWQPPKTVNGILAGYKVSYQPFSATTVTAEPPMDTLIYSNRSMTLTDLHPGTLYQVRIYAVNGAGLGQETVLRIYTLPYSPSDTTELTIYNASSAEPEMFTGSEINLSERISSSHIRKNLAAIVAGSLVGAVALTICTIFICIQCIKYRRKQRLDYIVSEDCVIISNDSSYFRPNESSLPADDFLSSPKPSLPFYSTPATSLSSSSSPQTLSGIVVTQPHQQPPVSKTTRARSLDSQSQTWNEKICDKRLDTSTNGSTEINGTNEQEDGYSSTKKSDLSRKRSFGGGVSLPQLLSKSYSKLDEDGNESVEGLENPMYQKPVVDVDEVVLRVHDSRSGFLRNQLRQSVKSFDTDSITSNTMRRKNKMRTESAAAIAVLRSTASSCNNILDTDAQDAEEEVEDFGSEVIFNERTVL